MKKSGIILIILALFSTCVFAIDSIYPDLRTPVLDERGRHKKDENGELMYQWHEYTYEINKATAIKIMEGYLDGTFRPDEPITRAEFIKTAMVLATNRTFDFSIAQTDSWHWAANYVAIAEMQGVIEKGQYDEAALEEPITRIEMVCILSKIQIRMKGISQYREANLPNYTDIDNLTTEEKDLLLHAARYELIDGMLEETEIKPNANLTRAEAAVALMRVY